MTDRPLVSVVVPVFNGEAFLGEALRSIGEDGYAPVEIIVVDDGSTDGSAAVARAFDGVRYLCQPNQGVAAARNAGIAAARGPLIAFLDQDDRWEPGKLQAQVAHLLAHPAVGLVLGHTRFVLEPGTTLPAGFPAAWLARELPAYFLGALLVRRAVLERVGGFDPAFRYGDDSDWLFRARDAGVVSTVLPRVVHTKRWHRANGSHARQAMAADLLRLVKSSIDRKRREGR